MPIIETMNLNRIPPLILLIALGAPAPRAQRIPLEPMENLVKTGRIDELLDSGADIDSKDPRGRTALIHAVESGEFRTVERILAAGAHPDITGPDGVSPLSAAVLLGREDLVTLLLSVGADPDMISDGPSGSDGPLRPVSPLSLAVDRGEFGIAGRLIEAGANGLYLAEAGAANPLNLPLLSTSLDSRIHRGLARLRDNTDSPDWRGEQWALHTAARDNRWFDAAAILDKAAGPGAAAPGVNFQAPASGAAAPSSPAAGTSSPGPGVVNLQAPAAAAGPGAGTSSPDPTLSAPAAAAPGAPAPPRPPFPFPGVVNAADSRGVTPLMTAVYHGGGAVVSLLLERGARIDALDSDGRDALCYAAAAGHEDILSLLAASETRAFAPASPVLETSPYYWAVIAGHPHILKRLIAMEYPAPESGSGGITLLMTAAWLSDTFAVRALLPIVDDAARRDDEGRSALEWSAAAFERDRRTGRETGRPERGARNYSAARLLARRSKPPRRVQPLITPDADPGVIEAWSPGGPQAAPVRGEAAVWREKRPSPVPLRPGDGDLTLYRILRDEEHLEPTGVIP